MNNINYSDSQSANNIGSIGTEYSNTSDNFNSLIQQATNGKQLFDNNDNLALEAAKDGEFSVLSYLIRKNKINNLAKQDKKNGFTILHYLIYNFSKVPNNTQVLEIILNNPNINKFVNIQDYINKDTPLHIATAFGLDNVVEKLIQKGADKTIRNNNNEYVCTENDQNDTDKSNMSNKNFNNNKTN